MSLETPVPEGASREADDGMTLGDMIRLLLGHRWWLIGGIVAGVLAGGAAIMLLPPTFTARALVLPPQQGQGAAALGNLGALAGLAGGLGMKTSGDQYIALMDSSAVTDAILDRFELQKVYQEKYRSEALRQLRRNTRLVLGKKDGLITIEVDDEDPKRAADIATAYIEGLRRLTNTLAVSEAQQRRQFFEQHLDSTKRKLVEAQVDLLGSGFTPDAIKADPRSIADGYARMRAEIVAAETRLQALRQSLTDSAPEVVQQRTVAASLRAELARLEAASARGAAEESATKRSPAGASPVDSGYVSKYREYKYQEMLFDMFARQYELARVDESKEGGLIQVVDAARAPDRKSKPKNSMIMGVSVGAGLVLAFVAVLLRRPRS